MFLFFNLAAILKTFVSVSSPLQLIEWAMFNQKGKVQLTIGSTYPF
jgi:hypothetical protein